MKYLKSIAGGDRQSLAVNRKGTMIGCMKIGFDHGVTGDIGEREISRGRKRRPSDNREGAAEIQDKRADRVLSSIG